MAKKLLTIVTTVYNRHKDLWDLYHSLCEQKNQNFLWIVIDDGSTDDAGAEVGKMQSEAGFDIIYRYKENGGKHTALNVAFDLLETELTFIVDSDDVLSDDATELIQAEWEKVRHKNLAGLIFLKGYKHGGVIGKEFPKAGIQNDIGMRTKYGVIGDKAEVWKTEILTQYRFPVFEHEKYQGENYIWQQIALEYDMMYVNRIIYFAEYLEGGLTRTGRILRVLSPLGGMENAKVSFHDEFPLKARIKKSWLFICYGKIAGKTFREIVKESGRPKLIVPNYVFGCLLYTYWNHKYLLKRKA